MGRRDRRRARRLVELLSMASAASALTLANFQAITSSGVSLSCLIVYNQQISGCTSTDFTKGSSCSTACQSGLAKTQANIQALCDDSEVSSSSVLGHAILGDLLGLLCPSGTSSSGASNPAVTQSNVAITSSRAQTTSQTVVTQPTTATTLVRGTTTQKQTNTSPTFTFPIQTSNAVPSTTLDSEPSTEQPTEQPTAQPTETLVSPQPATTQQQSISVATQQTSDTAQITPDAQTDGVGKGSPFDLPVENSSAHSITRWSEASVIAFAVALVLLQ